MSLDEMLFLAGFNGEDFSPEVSTSKKFKHWVSLDDEKRCFDCGENHGKIWEMKEPAKPKPPIHPWDRCEIQPMQAIKAGTATLSNPHTNPIRFSQLLFSQNLRKMLVNTKVFTAPFLLLLHKNHTTKTLRPLRREKFLFRQCARVKAG